MSVEQAYFFSVALINLVFALAGTRVKEHESRSSSIVFFMISFFAYFISWFIYVFEITLILKIVSALSASIFVWGMVIFGAKRCSVHFSWYLPSVFFVLQCVLQIYTLWQENLTIYLHVSAVFLPIAFFSIAYMFLKLKSERNPSDVVIGYAYIAMSFVIIARSIMLEAAPDLFAKSSLYSQIIWPAFCTIVGVFSLLSYTEEVQKRLETESKTDVLTNLANRRMFEIVLSDCLTSLARNNNYGALLYFDLDGFKPINDRFGHHIGDQVLIEIGNRLKASTRHNETIARLGGDEFALLIDYGGKDKALVKKEVEALATRIKNIIETPIHCEGVNIQVTSSIGIHIIESGSQCPEAILTEADNAMYHSKNLQKGTITFSDTLVKPEYSMARIGIQTIDSEHKKIDELVHALLNGDEINLQDFNQLYQLIEGHFSSEEEVSRQLGLNMTDLHRQDHKKILDALSSMANKNNNAITKTHIKSVCKMVSGHSFHYDKTLNISEDNQ